MVHVRLFSGRFLPSSDARALWWTASSATMNAGTHRPPSPQRMRGGHPDRQPEAPADRPCPPPEEAPAGRRGAAGGRRGGGPRQRRQPGGPRHAGPSLRPSGALLSVQTVKPSPSPLGAAPTPHAPYAVYVYIGTDPAAFIADTTPSAVLYASHPPLCAFLQHKYPIVHY